ncbi:MAG: hypothetical protein KA116_05550 [Proteobacteria bacterium]|nr:hypothetical protein [Pseudomonadota bacterium]
MFGLEHLKNKNLIFCLLVFLVSPQTMWAGLSCDEHLKIYDEKLGPFFVSLRDQQQSIGNSQHLRAPDRQTQSDLELNVLVEKLLPETSTVDNADGGYRTFEWTKLLLKSWLVNPVDDEMTLKNRQVSFQQLQNMGENRKLLKDELLKINQWMPRYRQNFKTLEFPALAPLMLPANISITLLNAYMLTYLAPGSTVSQKLYNSVVMYMFSMYLGVLGGAYDSMRGREQLIQWLSYSMASMKSILKLIPENSEGRLKDIRSAISDFLGKFPPEFFPEYENVKRYDSKSPMKRNWRSGVQVISGVSYFLNKNRIKVMKERLSDFATLFPYLVELDLYTRVADHMDSSWSMPNVDYNAADTFLNIHNGHHPILKITHSDKSISNSLKLSRGKGSYSGVLLTGPNFRGKSVFLKMLGTLSLMAQAGLPVPAQTISLSPQKVITNFRAIDSTEDAESLFFAQAKRIAHIQRSMKAEEPALYLFDEILTGTSPEEHAVLERLELHDLALNRAMFVFASHQRDLAKLADSHLGVLANKHMSDSDDPERKYRLEEGPSILRNALQVMKDAGVDISYLDRAAAELEMLYTDLEFRR